MSAMQDDLNDKTATHLQRDFGQKQNSQVTLNLFFKPQSRIWLRNCSPLWGKWRSQKSGMVPFAGAMVVFYRLSIVTIVLSLTIRSHRIFPMHISNAKLNRSLWGKIWEGGGLLI